MSPPNSLSAVLARIEAVQQALRAAMSRTDHDRKLEIVNLRRSLSVELGRVSEAAAAEPKIIGDEQIAREFRARFSAMRSSVALHQSQWPAVMLDEVNAGYHESMAAVRNASAAFLEWTRAQLAS